MSHSLHLQLKGIPPKFEKDNNNNLEMIVICIVLKILLLVYKALNGTVPYYISELFKYHTSERKLRSSSQHLVTLKAGMKTYRERAFAVAAPRLWNSIPLELRSSSSIDIFKRHLKTYLFKKAF